MADTTLAASQCCRQAQKPLPVTTTWISVSGVSGNQWSLMNWRRHILWECVMLCGFWGKDMKTTNDSSGRFQTIWSPLESLRRKYAKPKGETEGACARGGGAFCTRELTTFGKKWGKGTENGVRSSPVASRETGSQFHRGNGPHETTKIKALI